MLGGRTAVKGWLDTVKRIEAFRLVVDGILARGVGNNTFSPFNSQVPVPLGDRDGPAELVREHTHDGHTATVDAVFLGCSDQTRPRGGAEP